jgi:hypothetical protein
MSIVSDTVLWILRAIGSACGLVRRNLQMVWPTVSPKEESPLRFGILGAATIAPPALIWPIRTHPGAVVTAVAARDIEKARGFAKAHGIPRVFASYQGESCRRASRLP